MLDEDELNETPKSSSVDLPDEIPQPAPQLERGIEIVKTQTTMNSVVRNLEIIHLQHVP